MMLVAIVSITARPPRPPYLTPSYELLLACGHRVVRRLTGGPIPKQTAHCWRCANA